MTFQAVQEINNGADLEILYFDEGSPYSVSGCSVIDGRLEKPAVKEVYDFLMDTLCLEDKQNFSPESIFRDQDTPIENYPQDIPYSCLLYTSVFIPSKYFLALRGSTVSCMENGPSGASLHARTTWDWNSHCQPNPSFLSQQEANM